MQTALESFREAKTTVTVVLVAPATAKVGIVTEVSPTLVVLETASETTHHINPDHIVEVYETPAAVAAKVQSAAKRRIQRIR